MANHARLPPPPPNPALFLSFFALSTPPLPTPPSAQAAARRPHRRPPVTLRHGCAKPITTASSHPRDQTGAVLHRASPSRPVLRDVLCSPPTARTNPLLARWAVRVCPRPRVSTIIFGPHHPSPIPQLPGFSLIAAIQFFAIAQSPRRFLLRHHAPVCISRAHHLAAGLTRSRTCRARALVE